MDLLRQLWHNPAARIREIAALEPVLTKEADDELRKRSLALRYRAKSGEPQSRLMVEAFALVREAARRAIGLRHYDVQLLGGLALCSRSIAEMQTGEGKTLTATLPAFLYALAGRGSHVVTVNDYLARRDAEGMGPVYRLLGMSVGLVTADDKPRVRREAYACDVTYGTGKEFGFDFLRDRLALRQQGALPGEPSPHQQPPGTVQRALYFALVDEADSVLLDEAGTPLVISAAPGPAQEIDAACFRWAAGITGEFVELRHYALDARKRSVELTAEGRQMVRRLSKPPQLDSVGLIALYEYAERALRVDRFWRRDEQYIVVDDEVVIVDEFTGRVSEGRRWRDGIHQAVEAREGVTIHPQTGHAAQVTVQDFFRRYTHLAGMTGTAAGAGAELRRVYRLRVERIPTNRPPIRQQWPTRVFGTAEQKWRAVVEEVAGLHAQGRPVLIGTRSVEKSEIVARLLTQSGIEHQVLNARRPAEEATIVAEAGRRGRVTVATNMAGRGTDIKLDADVLELGGLHVVATEMHDSPRIDRQLIGRCGRQGDPGTWRQFLALDDDLLLAGFGHQRAEQLRRTGQRAAGELAGWFGTFQRAQRTVDRRAYRQRALLLYYEQQRHKAHQQLGQDPYLDAA